MTAAALALLALTAVAPAASKGGALENAASQLVARASALGKPDKIVLAVAVVSADTPDLGRSTQTVLVSQLTRVFKGVIPLHVSSLDTVEAEARQQSADWALRLTARMVGGELIVAGDAVPTWVNFWAGQTPVRAPGGEALSVRAPADAEVLALSRLGRPAGLQPGQVARRFSLRPIAQLPEKVLSVSAGDVDGDGLADVAVLTPTQVVLLRGDGQVLARYDHSKEPRAARPPREPAGAVAIGPFGPEPAKARVAWFYFGQARGSVLELERGELKAVQPLDAAPASAGAAGILWGAPQAGRNTLSPEVRAASGRTATLPLAAVAIAANPRAGAPAYLAVAADGTSAALDEQLQPLSIGLPALGAGLAVGDLDGDGAAELAASGLVLADDRVRILRLDGKAGPALFESDPIAGAIEAGAAADVNGDGRDEAILAAWTSDGGTQLFVLGGEP